MICIVRKTISTCTCQGLLLIHPIASNLSSAVRQHAFYVDARLHRQLRSMRFFISKLRRRGYPMEEIRQQLGRAVAAHQAQQTKQQQATHSRTHNIKNKQLYFETVWSSTLNLRFIKQQLRKLQSLLNVDCTIIATAVQPNNFRLLYRHNWPTKLFD
eukprot:TRINITY_DN9487_c0_g2_i1.p1 TRINITY_DN9487_c0_g2~~TRINITY_DN9487_c0_g2_i1.p1  ORF type:complete len:157 (-),score=29.50 TRINITY_DN9487_c0_g2_i1:336-806(-)